MLPEHLECRAVRLRPHKDSIIPMHVQVKLSNTNINPSLSLKSRSIKKLKETERARKPKATGCHGGKVSFSALEYFATFFFFYQNDFSVLQFSHLKMSTSSRIRCAIRRVKKISILP